MIKCNLKKVISLMTSVMILFCFSSGYLSNNSLTASAICCRKDGFDKSRYTLTGNMAQDVATIAKSQAGRTCSQFGYSGIDYGAWCDEYVADCLENAGCDDSIVAHGGTVADFENIMKRKGAVVVSSPQPGDLIFFSWSHVEIVTRVENDTVYCAGGNNQGKTYPGGRCAGERNAQSVAKSMNGSIRLYLRPNYSDLYVEPPKNCSISTDKIMYYVDEEVNFNFHVENATEIYIPIDYNGTRSDFINVSGKSNYSCTFNNPGVYGFFLYAKNPKGEISSIENYKTIIVYDKAPTNLSIKTTNNEYELGDDVTFNFDSMYDTELSIPIDYNGIRSDFIDVTNKKTLTYKFDKPGVYGYFLYAKNHYGESSTVDNYAQFTIYDEAPKNLKITNNKTAYKRNEKVEFQFNSKYAKELYIPIDFEGKRSDFIDVSGKTKFITQFDKVGNYGYFLYGRNKFGESSTVDDYIQFVVYDEGDCNNDGQFSVADVVILQKWLFNDETELTNWQSADLDEDGTINVFDLCLMKQKLINK